MSAEAGHACAAPRAGSFDHRQDGYLHRFRNTFPFLNDARQFGPIFLRSHHTLLGRFLGEEPQAVLKTVALQGKGGQRRFAHCLVQLSCSNESTDFYLGGMVAVPMKN